MKYGNLKSRIPEPQKDPRNELIALYNSGDMPEHPDLFGRPSASEKRLLTHDSDIWSR